MESLRKNQKEILVIKNTAVEMKNDFEGPIRRLDINEERISEVENILREYLKTKKQKETKTKKGQTI